MFARGALCRSAERLQVQVKQEIGRVCGSRKGIEVGRYCRSLNFVVQNVHVIEIQQDVAR